MNLMLAEILKTVTDVQNKKYSSLVGDFTTLKSDFDKLTGYCKSKNKTIT